MEKRERRKIILCFLLILVVAFFIDLKRQSQEKEGMIERADIGGDTKKVALILNAEGILNEYDYEIEIEPARISELDAKKYFEQTIEIIQNDFSSVEEMLPMEETYLNDIVDATWSFDENDFYDREKRILYEEIPKEGLLVNAQVTLSCGDYERIYAFPYTIFKKEETKEESLLREVSLWFERQMEIEGISYVQLPKEINGSNLTWEQEKESLTLKILFLEIIAIIMMIFGEKQVKLREQRKLQLEMEMEYPEIVSQLAILLGAGMTLRQAWNRMAHRYIEKKQAGIICQKEIYEAIWCMNRRITEGESERSAYQYFCELVDVVSYHRLMRMLIGNLEKGTRGICELLEGEGKQVYEQRIMLAKKMGEEASTKMLIPLMLMMVLVMMIVIMPAIISLSI